MTLPIRFSLALAGLLAATACATPASDTTPPTAEEPPMTCQADKGQWAVGKIADEALMAKVKADTTSERVRVIQPGMSVTMDYREDRLNLEVDAENRVLVVRCS